MGFDQTETEDLLTETGNKYVLFPIKYPDIYEMYKKAASAYWLPDEINFQQDVIDLEKLSENEKYFINHVLAFFAASDGIVMENLATRFSKDIPVPEVKSFYAFQNAMEAVHSETYSLLIDTYVKDPIQKDQLFNAVTNFPAIKTKADWAIQWIDNPTASFGQRLVGFAIVEGLFFSASFCAIFWLRERGLLPGLSFANQLIARDESMHTDFACLLYSKLNNRLPRESVESMIRDAVEIEKEFILESIPCSMIGMNQDLMTDYIKYIGDRLLLMLGYDKIYNTTNPFQFMEMSASETKASFFEVKVSSYAKPVSFVGGQSVIPTELSIDTSDDF
jgi:ribonucleotide reductase beta subunit family protein with ferritin-like domain